MKELKIWTDGSYRPSMDVGGVGMVVVGSTDIIYEYSRGYYKTTNNQMEIQAIIAALDWITESIDFITIFTDSQYCLGVINNGWKRNKNVELWNKFDTALKRATQICPTIWFRYTKGHAEDIFNNRADELATAASEKLKEEKLRQIFQKPKQMIIALDFDGTVVKHRYPDIGEDIGAVPVLHTLQNNNVQFILHTMRDTCSENRNCIKEAMDWFTKNHISIAGVNCNPWQKTWTNSEKVFAHLYIDDAALGIPLKRDTPAERPYVDWEKCLELLTNKGLITEEQAVSLQQTFNK